jgi:midasin
MKGETGALALESVCLITQALVLLDIGELSVAKFGEVTEIVHSFGEQWNDESGGSMVDSFQFDDEKTEVADLLLATISYLESMRKGESMQLCFIVSDGMFSNKERVRDLVIQAQLRKLLIVFVIIDSQNEKERQSILALRSFVNIGGKTMVAQYLDDFPFPFYVLLRDPESLPERLADALRQWFDLVNGQQ